MICMLIHKAQGKWSDKRGAQIKEMSVLQTASHIGKWWAKGPQQNPTSSQRQACPCGLSPAKTPSLDLFFHLTSRFSVITLRTDPISDQYIFLTCYIFTLQPTRFSYTWPGPLAGTSTDLYKITSLSFLSAFHCNASQKALYKRPAGAVGMLRRPALGVIHFVHLFTRVHRSLSEAPRCVPKLSVGRDFVSFSIYI